MNRTELVRAVSRKIDQPQWAVDLMLEGLTDVVAMTLSVGEDVTIRGFGKFAVQHHREAQRPHPGTGERITIPAYDTAKFVPSPALRGRMNAEDVPADAF